MSCMRFRYPRLKKLHAGVRNALVNIGAGESGRSGWINIDAFPRANISIVCDCRQKLPLPDGSARGVFTEHFFEHLEYYSEGPAFIRDAFRILRPGGTLRIVVPDAEQYLRAYCTDGWAPMISLRKLQADMTDPWLQVRVKSKMEMVNIVFRQLGEHKFAYDYDTMELVLAEAGFTRIERSRFGVSRDPEMAIDLESRARESMYVEATRP